MERTAAIWRRMAARPDLLLMCAGTKGVSSLASHLAALDRATILVAVSPTSCVNEP